MAKDHGHQSRLTLPERKVLPARGTGEVTDATNPNQVPSRRFAVRTRLNGGKLILRYFLTDDVRIVFSSGDDGQCPEIRVPNDFPELVLGHRPG